MMFIFQIKHELCARYKFKIFVLFFLNDNKVQNVNYIKTSKQKECKSYALNANKI